MAASLIVQFADGPLPGDRNQDAARFAVAEAFGEWTRHFDYTAGVFTINVSFRAGTQPADFRLDVQDFTQVGVNASRSVFEPSFGLSFAARAASSTIVPASTLFINPANFNAVNSNIVAAIERELGHALGISRLRTGTALTSILIQPPLQTRETVYDTGIRVAQGTFNPVTTFNGPNAEAAYGGPVPVDAGNTKVTTVGGGLAVATTIQAASTVQPLDVALLRDAGLPALTDQELLEHAIARLYYGAFGRVADGAGLVQQTAGYQTALSGLVTVGDRLVGSAEFAARYGTLSDADFIRTVFQNVYGRPPTDADLSAGLRSLQPGRFGFTRGGLLSVYTQSDEARGRLSANANITYSGTAEAQVARLHDTAFGRDADPGGFALYAKALINGTTLQQAAQSFLGSAEFANRYGAASSDQVLVDALYQNALHRVPDIAGEALYARALAFGQFKRADLLVAFSNSQEHINLIAQRTAARDAGGFNVDLSPHLGIIPVISGPVTA